MVSSPQAAAARGWALAPLLEFSRIGFVNILAFRLRYYTGILTYVFNVTVYYFIWRAVFGHAAGAGAASQTASLAGYNLPQMLTYVSVGWIMRSFYWNTIDQEMAYEVLEGKIAMELIKPVSVQWMWIFRSAGESLFRLVLLTAPAAVVISLIFPVQRPASRAQIAPFLLAVLASFLLMAAINFLIGTCAIPLKSILALIRAKFWLIELLSGLLIPIPFFPHWAQIVSRCLPFEQIAYAPLQIYLGKLAGWAAWRAVGISWAWVAVLLALGHIWWQRSLQKITIHGG
ncbi:MAG: ABC transporter permease [Candidatus Acidiferrales bacterium]